MIQERIRQGRRAMMSFEYEETLASLEARMAKQENMVCASRNYGRNNLQPNQHFFLKAPASALTEESLWASQTLSSQG